MTIAPRLAAAALGLGLTAFAPAAMAACQSETPREDMGYGDATALYDCLRDALYAGYNAGDPRWIPAEHLTGYRDWALASTMPADPGVHGERFLMTRVNAIGYETYTRFGAEDVAFPAGAVISKESFTIDAAGVATPGPLFLMEKVAEGESPETNDWHYMMVSATGAPQAIDVMTACQSCHALYEDQDQVAYPEPELRVGG